jgi:hypothetical protein
VHKKRTKKEGHKHIKLDILEKEKKEKQNFFGKRRERNEERK